jgi:release factor glutamine methyltransferase
MEAPTLRQLRRAAEALLSDAGCDTPSLDARLLIQHALDLDRADLLFMSDKRLDPAQAATAWELVERRAARAPVSRIIGKRGFWTLDLGVNAATLDPRPDTETVVDAILEARPDRDAPLRILDLGTGSGAILLALLSEYPAATGVGVDLAAGAAAQAALNAQACELDGRARFMVGNWGDGLTAGAFDVIVSNPPYIPSAEIETLAPEVREHDPLQALDGGADGLDAYRLLADQAPGLLADGGVVAFEVGCGQADQVAELLTLAGLNVTGVRVDLGGIARCVRAEKHSVAEMQPANV